MNFKSELAPKGLQFNPADFVISDRYATILTVVSYPRLIGPGYLSNLTNMSGVKVVIKHIPLPFSVLAKIICPCSKVIFSGTFNGLKLFFK